MTFDAVGVQSGAWGGCTVRSRGCAGREIGCRFRAIASWERCCSWCGSLKKKDDVFESVQGGLYMSVVSFGIHEQPDAYRVCLSEGFAFQSIGQSFSKAVSSH
jgi:hypothetical protein